MDNLPYSLLLPFLSAAKPIGSSHCSLCRILPALPRVQAKSFMPPYYPCHLQPPHLSSSSAFNLSAWSSWPHAVPRALQECLRAFTYTVPSAGNAGAPHRSLFHVCSAFMDQRGWAGLGWGFDAVMQRRLPAIWGTMVRDPELCCVRVTCWKGSQPVPVSLPQSHLHF